MVFDNFFLIFEFGGKEAVNLITFSIWKPPN